MKRFPLWLAALVLLLMLGFCSLVSADLPERDTAWLMAHVFVKKTLKAPSTAQFCDLNDRDGYCWKRRDGQWEATGWVDSQNGFGAMIRNNWHVVLMPLKNEKGEWLRVYYSFGENTFGDYPEDTAAPAAPAVAQ